MDYNVRDVALDRIETSDPTFRITTNRTTRDLALSISAIGLLHPPLLLESADRYVVISGFRRIAACESMAAATVPACIVSARRPRLDCVRLAIADNATQRSLNIVEQSRAAALIHRFAGHADDRRTLAAAAGLSGSPTALERLLPFAGMPGPLQEAVVDGTIAAPIALHIDRLEGDDAAALCTFLRRITTGLNIQRELVEAIGDIAARDDTSIAALLAGDDVAAILNDDGTSTPEKVQRLRRFFKHRRYPALSRAESLYQQALKAMRVNPCIQIQPPRFFEGETYRLTVAVASRGQLRAILPEIERIAENPHLLPE